MSIVLYLIVYVLIIIFLIFIRFFRFGAKAKELLKTEHDQNTTKLLGIAFVSCIFFLLVAPVLNFYNMGSLVPITLFFIIGIFIMIIGMLIRIQAVRTLGRNYTSTLQTQEGQTIINKGFYKYIRHPGYLGNIFLFLGSGIAVCNEFVFVILAIILIPVYLRRIKYEEIMLENIFKDQYRVYKSNTKKLIPFLL